MSAEVVAFSPAQSLFWISYSPIADNAKAYYNIDDSIVTWWMNVRTAALTWC